MNGPCVLILVVWAAAQMIVSITAIVVDRGRPVEQRRRVPRLLAATLLAATAGGFGIAFACDAWRPSQNAEIPLPIAEGMQTALQGTAAALHALAPPPALRKPEAFWIATLGFLILFLMSPCCLMALH